MATNKKVNISLQIPVKLYKRLKALKKRYKRGISEMVREAILEHI